MNGLKCFKHSSTKKPQIQYNTIVIQFIAHFLTEYREHLESQHVARFGRLNPGRIGMGNGMGRMGSMGILSNHEAYPSVKS